MALQKSEQILLNELIKSSKEKKFIFRKSDWPNLTHKHFSHVFEYHNVENLNKNFFKAYRDYFINYYNGASPNSNTSLFKHYHVQLAITHINQIDETNKFSQMKAISIIGMIAAVISASVAMGAFFIGRQAKDKIDLFESTYFKKNYKTPNSNTAPSNLHLKPKNEKTSLKSNTEN